MTDHPATDLGSEQAFQVLMKSLTEAMQHHEADTVQALIPTVQELPICPRCRIVVAGWMAALAEGLREHQGMSEQDTADVLADRLDDIFAEQERETNWKG